MKKLKNLYFEIREDFIMTLFLSLSLSTGGRKSTILNYTVKDIDMSHKIINSYDYKNKSTYKSFIDEQSYDLLKIRLKTTTDKNEKIISIVGVFDIDRWISRRFKIV